MLAVNCIMDSIAQSWRCLRSWGGENISETQTLLHSEAEQNLWMKEWINEWMNLVNVRKLKLVSFRTRNHLKIFSSKVRSFWPKIWKNKKNQDFFQKFFWKNPFYPFGLIQDFFKWINPPFQPCFLGKKKVFSAFFQH